MTDAVDKDLLPCPFCGGRAEMVYDDWGYYPGKYHVGCTVCAARTEEFADGRYDESGMKTLKITEEAKSAAADAWNIRAAKGGAS